MKFLGLVLAAFLLSGCQPPSIESPSPHAITPPDTDLCGKACDHIGPQDLNCEEGKPTFDSSLNRNVSCEEQCQYFQANGAFFNPRCVAIVPTCAQIEAYRQKDCSTPTESK